MARPEGELKMRTGVPVNWRMVVPVEKLAPVHVWSWVRPLMRRMVMSVEPFQTPSEMVLGRVVTRVRLSALKTTPLPMTMRLPSGLMRMGAVKL